MLHILLAAQVWQLVTAALPKLNGSAIAQNPYILNIPMFRTPLRNEKDILWSAHGTGDTRLPLIFDAPNRIACLLDGQNANFSTPVNSLAWVVLDEATGQETRYKMSGSGRPISFTAGPLDLIGKFDEWKGSVLSAKPRLILRADVRIRCEYQPAGFSTLISSSWLNLWDERTEFDRLKHVSLRCNRTILVKHLTADITRDQQAVVYDCQGINDTRLLEPALVTIKVISNRTESKSRETPKLLSNSSSRAFFGYAFNGIIRFGWVISNGWGNNSLPPGAILERHLQEPEARMELTLTSNLHRGSTLTVKFTVPKITSSFWLPISSLDTLIMPVLEGPRERQIVKVHHDNLQGPGVRALPCPLLCLPGSISDCQHSWSGPGTDALPQTLLFSQPFALPLNTSTSANWTCSSRRGRSSITYAVTLRPRPRIYGLPMPPRSVVFPPDSLRLRCGLNGLAANTSVEFDVIESNGVATYNVHRTVQREQNDSAVLELSFSDFSPQKDGAVIVLRCRAVESDGNQAVAAFSVIHVLPLPVLNPLNNCSTIDRPCQVDCRSSLAPRLRPLRVCVTYLFSLYSKAGKLRKLVPSKSGILEDVWKEIGGYATEPLIPECKQIFFYCDERSRFSVKQLFIMDSETSSTMVDSKVDETKYKGLILVISDKLKKHRPPKETDQELVRKRLMFILIVITLLPAICLIALGCKLIYNCTRPKKPATKESSMPSYPKSRGGSQPMQQPGTIGVSREFRPVKVAGRTLEPLRLPVRDPSLQFSQPVNPWQQPIRRVEVPRGPWEISQESDDSPPDLNKLISKADKTKPFLSNIETNVASQSSVVSVEAEPGSVAPLFTSTDKASAFQSAAGTAAVATAGQTQSTIALEGGTENTPVSTGQSQTPVSTGQSQTPVSAGQPQTPASAGQPQTPVSTGQPQTPVSAGQTPASAGQPQTPVSIGQPQTPVSIGQPQTPASAGQTPTPVPADQTQNTAAPGTQSKNVAPLSVLSTQNTTPPMDYINNLSDSAQLGKSGESSENHYAPVGSFSPVEKGAATTTVQADSASTDSEARTPDLQSSTDLQSSNDEPCKGQVNSNQQTEKRPRTKGIPPYQNTSYKKGSRSKFRCHSFEHTEAVHSAAPATRSKTRSPASERAKLSSTSPGSISGVGFDFCLNLHSDLDGNSTFRQ